MEYFKNLILIDGERIRVTPDQYQAYVAAEARGDKHILIDGNMYKLSTIARTEDTTEAVGSGLALPGSTEPDHKHEPEYIDLNDGYRPAVKTVLVKTKVTRKYYEKWLAARSTVTLLENDGAWVWVSMTHVPCKVCGITKPDSIECDEEEYIRSGWKRGGERADVQNHG